MRRPSFVRLPSPLRTVSFPTPFLDCHEPDTPMKPIPINYNIHKSLPLPMSSTRFISASRRTRNRYLAFVALFFLSSLIFITVSTKMSLVPSISITAPPVKLHQRWSRRRSGSTQYPLRFSITDSRPQIELTPNQELAALLHMIASPSSVNALPATVDPTQPLDPELVCSFDTRSGGRAMEEVKSMEIETWDVWPIVIFREQLRSPAARTLISHLPSTLSPPPLIISTDTRPDAHILPPLLQRLTGESKLPILLIGGKVIKYEDVESLKTSGELERMLNNAGVTTLLKKKGRR